MKVFADFSLDSIPTVSSGTWGTSPLKKTSPWTLSRLFRRELGYVAIKNNFSIVTQFVVLQKELLTIEFFVDCSDRSMVILVEKLQRKHYTYTNFVV